MRKAPEVYGKKAWRKCRDAYAKSVGGLCERCKSKGIITAGVIVHHKKHLNEHNKEDASVVYGYDNLELLCMKCHNEEHLKRKKRYTVDENGKIFSR